MCKELATHLPLNSPVSDKKHAKFYGKLITLPQKTSQHGAEMEAAKG